MRNITVVNTVSGVFVSKTENTNFWDLEPRSLSYSHWNYQI